MDAKIQKLTKLISEQKLIPFIGAGFSVSSGLPSSEQLIEHLITSFNIERKLLTNNINLWQLAEYLKIINDNDISPVKNEIQQLFNADKIDISKAYSHLSLAKLGFSSIYTSNYDCLIEKTFSYLHLPYYSIVTTADIVRSAASSSTQIVKFHGSIEELNSIIISESELFQRLEFESAIDIKLRADMLGKGILFIGYSFSDFNVRYLWFKLQKMMREVSEKEIPPSFILLSRKNRIIEDVLENRGIIPLFLANYPGNNQNEQVINFMQILHKSI